jgi:hypothetical protein
MADRPAATRVPWEGSNAPIGWPVPFPGTVIEEAEFPRPGIRAGIRRLLESFPHRNHQLRVLGIPKNTMVDYLESGFSLADGLVLVARAGMRLLGVLQAVPETRMSQDLDRRIWSVRHLLLDDDCPAATSRRLVGATLNRLVGRADLVGARVASGDVAGLQAVEDLGFRVVTGELAGVVDLVEATHSVPGAPSVISLEPEHLDEVASIAGDAHVHNRFRYDPHFEPGVVRRMYGELIRRYADDPNTGTRVAVDGRGRVLGFISFRINRALEAATGKLLASLDFIGVRKDARVRGLGDALNHHAMAAMTERGVEAATVRTLMDNFEALAALRKLDLRITSSNLVLHRWMT